MILSDISKYYAIICHNYVRKHIQSHIQCGKTLSNTYEFIPAAIVASINVPRHSAASAR